MRLVLLAVLLLPLGCNVRLATPGSTPAPPATDCLSLGSDSGRSLPSAADIAALTSGVPPAASAPSAAPSYFLHVPPNAPSDQPVQVLLLLHGFGGQGQDFAQQFLSVADANQWIVVAPTLNYTSLTDAAATRADDLQISQELMAILTDVPQRSGLAVNDRVLLVGFSRGGSMAERFALLHPELVQAVAALSGGAYTVPQDCVTQDGTVESLPLPLGTADLQNVAGFPLSADAFRRIPFWLSVGSQDVQPVPSAYDNVLGQTRVARGAALQQALVAFGVQSQFTVFPGIAHAVTDGMVSSSSAFLAAATGG
jgi:predicted peptidase